MNIIECMNDPGLFEPWFRGPSWDAWRVVLKASTALPMVASEREKFREIAGREPPSTPPRECWYCVGRRGGKDSVVSLVGTHKSAFFDPRGKLRPGERAVVMCLACDREQAGIVLGYIKSYFTEIPYLKAMVRGETNGGLELSNSVDIVVATNDYRSVRGRSILCAIFDEVAFWRDDRSAAPDRETYAAILPGTMTLGGTIIGISSPHRKSGLLYNKWREHYGRDDSDVLVIRAPSIAMNPTLDAKLIEVEIERDPAIGRAEWLAEWRDDLASFVSRELIEAAVDTGVTVRPRIPGVKYFCMIDPSGGVGDSMTLGVAHREPDSRVVLDAVVERPAPFQAQQIVTEFAGIMRQYGLHSCTSDRYAASWVSQAFAARGVTVVHSARDRSAIYLDLLPLLTSGGARLLDNKRLINQLAQLERRATPTRDRVDHPTGGKDDVANAAAGALVLAADVSARVPIVGPMAIDLRSGAIMPWGTFSNPAASRSGRLGYGNA